MKKKPLPPAAVIHQARQKLMAVIERLIAAHRFDARNPVCAEAWGEVLAAKRQMDKQVSIYTRTVRRTK